MASLTWAVLLLAGLTCTSALGTPTNILDNPSIVQVEYRLYTAWSQQCIGNIITYYHIVSAASCFQDLYSNRRIRAGTDVRGSGGTIAEISTVRDHPTFGGYDGDITIVRLQTYLVQSQAIRSIAIVPQNYFITPEQRVTLVGWGSTAQGGIISDNYLYSLDLVNKNILECQRLYANVPNSRNITSNMLCAGLSTYGGRDIDSRDYGAPILLYNALAGLVSFGVPYGQDAFPLAITAISAYSNWIIETAANTF